MDKGKYAGRCKAVSAPVNRWYKLIIRPIYDKNNRNSSAMEEYKNCLVIRLPMLYTIDNT